MKKHVAKIKKKIHKFENKKQNTNIFRRSERVIIKLLIFS